MTDLPEISDWELARLRDCEVSTRIMGEDRGFPDTMRKLAVHGLVEKVGDGYRVSDFGYVFLRNLKTRLQLDRL